MEGDLGGYSVCHGTQLGNYDSIIDAGNLTQYAVVGLATKTRYYLALRAYDFYGNESDFSAEVSGVSPANPSPTPIPVGGAGALSPQQPMAHISIPTSKSFEGSGMNF